MYALETILNTRKLNFKILQTPLFISALLLLILNDFYLKTTFSNVLTGKLSDFTGLFIFPVFWTVFFRKYKILIYVFTALFFIYWKSNYSSALINFWNTHLPFSITRVKDYTDLMALVVLPFSYYFEKYGKKRVNLNPFIIICISSFAFLATSKAQSHVDINKSLQINGSPQKTMEHIKGLKEVEVYSHQQFLAQNPDTIRIRFKTNECQKGIDIETIITHLYNDQTLITFTYASTSCYKDIDIKNEVRYKIMKPLQQFEN